VDRVAAKESQLFLIEVTAKHDEARRAREMEKAFEQGSVFDEVFPMGLRKRTFYADSQGLCTGRRPAPARARFRASFLLRRVGSHQASSSGASTMTSGCRTFRSATLLWPTSCSTRAFISSSVARYPKLLWMGALDTGRAKRRRVKAHQMSRETRKRRPCEIRASAPAPRRAHRDIDLPVSSSVLRSLRTQGQPPAPAAVSPAPETPTAVLGAPSSSWVTVRVAIPSPMSAISQVTRFAPSALSSGSHRWRQVWTRDDGQDWEAKLEPPVNQVLPVARDALARLEAAFGEGVGDRRLS